MPTRAGWGVAVGAIVGVAMGRLLGVAELYVLAAVAGALVLAAVVWVQRPVPRLEIDRATHPSTLTAGAPARIEIHVANRGEGRSPAVSLLDPVEGTVGARLVIGPLAPGAGQDLGYRLPGLHRGLFHVGPLTAEVLDPFGLARRRLAGAAELVLTVLPASDPAPLPPRRSPA